MKFEIIFAGRVEMIMSIMVVKKVIAKEAPAVFRTST